MRFADALAVTADPTGTRDIEPPDEERIYVVAGHQHGSGMPLRSDTTPIGARGANPFNMVDGSTALRAFLINLDRWVSEGVEPPPSEFPRLADGSAVAREELLAQFDAFPNISLLDPEQLPRLRRLDLGPDTDRGIARLPAQTGQPFSYKDACVELNPHVGYDAAATSDAKIRVAKILDTVAGYK